MSVFVNGHSHPLPEPATLAALLRSLSPSVPFVVARNDEVVSGREYEACQIEPGDRIDIVHPAAGG